MSTAQIIDFAFELVAVVAVMWKEYTGMSRINKNVSDTKNRGGKC